MPSVAEATVSAPRSQHSCFAALAKNSHPRTVFTALRAAASRRSIPTVTSFPQNDKLQERVRRLIRISIIKTKRTPVPPCHCERSAAISRKGNVGNEPAPANSPAQALRREIPRERNGNNRTRKTRILARAGSAPFAVKHYAAGRGRPALPTASPRIGYAVISTEAVAKWRPPREKCHRSNTNTPNTRPRWLTVEKFPYGRNGTPHIRAGSLARGGSPPCPQRLTAFRSLFYHKTN